MQNKKEERIARHNLANYRLGAHRHQQQRPTTSPERAGDGRYSAEIHLPVVVGVEALPAREDLVEEAVRDRAERGRAEHGAVLRAHALHGAPRAHDDDPYRAVRAALELHRTLDDRSLAGLTTVRVKVGIATGEVVVDV